MGTFIFGLFVGCMIGYILSRRYSRTHPNKRKEDKRQSVSAISDDGAIYAQPYGNLILIHIDRDDEQPRIRLDHQSAYALGRQILELTGQPQTPVQYVQPQYPAFGPPPQPQYPQQYYPPQYPPATYPTYDRSSQNGDS